ncbi:TIGR01777 family oxidoreductase [Paraconexibacter antarcticus]|uniref:TIGR01777 family oxidoreductase n=1 Tax=Paraconexibacter antarcticus TaxID=2949664 RepID=A0ABY5DL05_9ACTN|nr:TIGR01777 family oxidoreductase [Paraconexibacter antarcticus]UTI62451.1 TIGR01777 family oxidoreductase [Paraconexibacter antarcticus]
MKITVTGATGLIGARLVAALKDRGDDVTVLSRNPEKAGQALGVQALAWDALNEPAPVAALAGRDAIVHLAGEPVAQRWNAARKQAINDSREIGSRNLVAGIAAADPRPAALISSSAVGYYGKHGDEKVPEDTPAGSDFLAKVCVVWEAEADKALTLGVRVAHIRTGVVLDRSGGALKTMLPPFRMGVGGPVAGGGQYMPWIHLDDIVGLYLKAIDDGSWSGAYNGSAPEPVTNKVFSKALGKALHRPAFAPVPAFAIKLLYGEMSEIVTEGQRAVPSRALAGGYAFRHPDLDEALASALS